MATDMVFEVTNSAAAGSTKFNNVMHFMYPAAGPPTNTSLTAMLNKIRTGWYDALSTNGPAIEWTIGSKVTVFPKASPGSKTFVPVAPVYSNLATSGTLAVTQLSVCMNWFSDTPGRSSTGRTFYGPLKTESIVSARLSTGALSSFTSVGSFFAAGFGSLPDPWWFGVYSKKNKQFYPVIVGHTDGIVDTLRSRKT